MLCKFQCIIKLSIGVITCSKFILWFYENQWSRVHILDPHPSCLCLRKRKSPNIGCNHPVLVWYIDLCLVLTLVARTLLVLCDSSKEENLQSWFGHYAIYLEVLQVRVRTLFLQILNLLILVLTHFSNLKVLSLFQNGVQFHVYITHSPMQEIV